MNHTKYLPTTNCLRTCAIWMFWISRRFWIICWKGTKGIWFLLILGRRWSLWTPISIWGNCLVRSIWPRYVRRLLMPTYRRMNPTRIWSLVRPICTWKHPERSRLSLYLARVVRERLNQPNTAWRSLPHWVIPLIPSTKTTITLSKKRSSHVTLYSKRSVTVKPYVTTTQADSVSMYKCILVKTML